MEPDRGLTGWWRHSEYEVRDGLVCPVREAKLEEYDPWWEFEGGKRAGTGEAAPYRSLLEVLEQRGNRAAMEASIAAWCSENGPLGVLLHRTLAVTAGWRPIGSELGEGTSQFGTMVRTAIGWRGGHPIIPEGALPQSSGGDAPQALVTALDSDVASWEPLSDTWHRFFAPEVVTSGAFPQPDTRRFAHHYVEPVEDFIKAAWVLGHGIEEAEKARGSVRGASGTPRALSDALAMEGLVPLNLMMSGMGVALHARFGQVYMDVTSPSLLGILARMAAQDLAAGRLVRCEYEGCRKFFESEAYQAKYCSKTCQGTASKRRVRDRQKRAREMAADGVPLEKIRDRLSPRPSMETVKRWLQVESGREEGER